MFYKTKYYCKYIYNNLNKSYNVGTGLVAKDCCNDILKLQIKVNENDIIIETKFTNINCESAIDSILLITKLIKNKHIDDIFIKNINIIKNNCSNMAKGAIQIAINDYKENKLK